MANTRTTNYSPNNKTPYVQRYSAIDSLSPSIIFRSFRTPQRSKNSRPLALTQGYPWPHRSCRLWTETWWLILIYLICLFWMWVSYCAWWVSWRGAAYYWWILKLKMWRWAGSCHFELIWLDIVRTCPQESELEVLVVKYLFVPKSITRMIGNLWHH